MKRWLVGLCLLPLLASASPREEYAWQWPLRLARPDGGAYRVTLDESVYRQVVGSGLRDLDVLDSTGRPVPAAVLSPDQAMPSSPVPSVRRVALPWFPLPATPSDGASPSGWELISETDTDGRLRRVEARGPAAQSTPRTGLLIDASAVKAPIRALELEWAPGAALDAGYRVEASDDLDHWRRIDARGRLLDLQRDGQRLLSRRIVLGDDGERARYLRLTPERPEATVPIRSVAAELRSPATSAPMQWIALNGRRVAPDAGTAKNAVVFEFHAGGRFPAREADVALPGNHAIEWRLESRRGSGSPWRLHAAPWVVYSVSADGQGSRSAPLALDGVVRDCRWRLIATGDVPGAPVLRLGYRPESMVFLAQGTPPYTLVAGSARAVRAESPMPQLLAALRQQRGAAWQPSEATLGAGNALAGAAALSAPMPPRDWRTWLLWGVLALGALLVTGFSLNLLRSPAPSDS